MLAGDLWGFGAADLGDVQRFIHSVQQHLHIHRSVRQTVDRCKEKRHVGSR